MIRPDAIALQLHWHVIGPIQWRLRKKRLQRFQREGEPIPLATLDARPDTATRSCAMIAARTRRYFARFNTPQSFSSGAGKRPTACMLDLTAFPDFDGYSALVAKRSKGYHNRSVKGARKRGMSARIIDHKGYEASMLAINQSKMFRTGGLMFDAIFPHKPATDTLRPPRPPACREHWTIDWGAFVPNEDGTERLVAYASLRRGGNFAILTRLLGHADSLRAGASKLLLFDIVKWLLEREDAAVQGLEFLNYGAIEDGGEGLLEWKRRILFRPFLLATP